MVLVLVVHSPDIMQAAFGLYGNIENMQKNSRRAGMQRDGRHTCAYNSQWPSVHVHEWYHLIFSKQEHFLSTTKDRKPYFRQKAGHEIKEGYFGNRKQTRERKQGEKRGLIGQSEYYQSTFCACIKPILLQLCVCVCVHVFAYVTEHVEVRRELARVGFPLPLCGSQGLRSSGLGVCLPDEPSHWSEANVLHN